MTSKKGIVAFFKDVFSEMRKTSWPKSEEVKKTVLAVAVVCAVYALLAGGSDFLINLFFKYVLKI